MISKRAASMESSGIRKVFDLAAKVRSPLNLSIGQPDFDVPEVYKRTAVAAIAAGRNSYAPTGGIPELRSALAAHLGKRYAWKPEDLVVTAGVSGGLALAFLATLDPGDEVLLPDPYFVSYKQLPLMCGARPVFYSTYPDWRIDAGRVEALITPRTRALLVNSPANPTGAVAGEAVLGELADLARRHDLLVLSDEVYDDFCYEPGPQALDPAGRAGASRSDPPGALRGRADGPAPDLKNGPAAAETQAGSRRVPAESSP